MIWPATTFCWAHTIGTSPTMSLINIFKHTEKCKEEYKECLHTLHLDSAIVIIFQIHLSTFISPVSHPPTPHPRPELLKSKLLPH